MVKIEDFVISKEINYVYMTSSQNKFVLSNLSTVMNFFKCEKALCFLCKSKKVSYSSFYEDKWFLNSDISVYFTLFESNFVNY